MAIADALSIKTTFNLDSSPKNFNISDDTDYAGESIALADVVGIFRVTDPLGTVVYQNTGWDTVFTSPDIDANVSLDFNTVPLPLASDGEVIKGVYTIDYKIKVTGATQNGEYLLTKSYDYQFTEPCVVLDLSYNCLESEITSIDNTVYGSYWTSTKRVIALIPPTGSGLNSTEGSGQSYSVTPVTTKTWQTTLSNVGTYTYPDGHIVHITIRGHDSVDVVCDIGECEIYDCLKALEKEYSNALCNNPTLAEKARLNLVKAQMYYDLYKAAQSCGKTQDALNYRQKVLSCCTTCTVACDDGLPVIIEASTFANCPTLYRLTNCDDTTESITTCQDLEDYNEKVIRIEEFGAKCWLVTKLSITITSSHLDCDTCP